MLFSRTEAKFYSSSQRTRNCSWQFVLWPTGYTQVAGSQEESLHPWEGSDWSAPGWNRIQIDALAFSHLFPGSGGWTVSSWLKQVMNRKFMEMATKWRVCEFGTSGWHRRLFGLLEKGRMILCGMCASWPFDSTSSAHCEDFLVGQKVIA